MYRHPQKYGPRDADKKCCDQSPEVDNLSKLLDFGGCQLNLPRYTRPFHCNRPRGLNLLSDDLSSAYLYTGSCLRRCTLPIRHGFKLSFPPVPRAGRERGPCQNRRVLSQRSRPNSESTSSLSDHAEPNWPKLSLS